MADTSLHSTHHLTFSLTLCVMENGNYEYKNHYMDKNNDLHDLQYP